MFKDKRKGKIGIRAAGLGVPILAVIFLAQVAAADEVVNTGYFGDVAIKGYDPVAYFTESRAVEGSPRILASVARGDLALQQCEEPRSICE